MRTAIFRVVNYCHPDFMGVFGAIFSQRLKMDESTIWLFNIAMV
jgi:hypothetical protein